jgi:DNA ligase (NAD+)
VNNLILAIEKARRIKLDRFISALSIPHIGSETAKELASYFKTADKFSRVSAEDLESLNGVGPVVTKAILDWFSDRDNLRTFNALKSELIIEKWDKEETRGKFSGLKFVLTGTLETMDRAKAKEKIEEFGGKVLNSVSNSTDYVVAGKSPGNKINEAKKMNISIKFRYFV